METIHRVEPATSSALIAWLLACALFLALVLPRLQQPVTDDEIYEVRNAERLIAGEQIHLYVPPIYDLVLAGVILAAGNSDASLRLPGIACAVMTLGMTWLLSLQLGLSLWQRLLCLVLLCTAPAFVQGALLVHIDNTLLVPSCSAFVWASLRWWRAPAHTRWFTGLLSCGLLALALLVKFSTPLMMVAGIGTALLWRDRQRVVGFAWIVAGGMIGFAVIWWALAYWLQLNPLEPFQFVLERADRQRGSWVTWIQTWVRNLWTLAAWLTPWLMLGTLWAWRRLSDLKTPHLIVAMAALAVFAYLPLTSINHGFPKYYLPALPLMVIGVVQSLTEDARGLWMGPATIVIGLFVILIGHEPIYFLRYDLRQLLVQGQDPTLAILGQAAMWVTPAVGLVWWGRRRLRPVFSPGGILFVLCLACGLATSVQQSFGDYQTNYSYGERGTGEMLNHLRRKLAPGDRIVATQDVLYRLGRHDQALPDAVWGSPTRLADELSLASTRFAVISLPSQSQAMLKSWHQPPLLGVLAQFDSVRIGTHVIYSRH
ncbi:MAG: hypothetical protein HN712_05180 [Gemmatimonadetes bacterium]|nr:hypothetical protein [Gemmatimonadota bacterium]MBT7859680.1 hypothetical protein [Gemmatimonadota bacterium]